MQRIPIIISTQEIGRVKKAAAGYDLIMASSSKEKTFSWISSLSERFSLVEMIATGIVYLKDNQTNTYTPFISAKGKYCNYDKASGNILEV